jgi:hypothetical protein
VSRPSAGLLTWGEVGQVVCLFHDRCLSVGLSMSRSSLVQDLALGRIKLTYGRRSGRLHPVSAFDGPGSVWRYPSSLRWFRPCNPPVRRPASTEVVQTSVIGETSRRGGARLRLHDRPLDRLADRRVSPKRDEQLSRQGDDELLFGAAAARVGKLVLIPARQRRVGLMRRPEPSSWIIVVRRRGLPALDTPCSWSSWPLIQGVDVKPAKEPA